MTDWKLLVPALGLDIPAEDVARVTTPLGALETAFRPLTADLPLELEPSVAYECPEEAAS